MNVRHLTLTPVWTMINVLTLYPILTFKSPHLYVLYLQTLMNVQHLTLTPVWTMSTVLTLTAGSSARVQITTGYWVMDSPVNVSNHNCIINPLTAKLFDLNFDLLEAVSR